jgi:hypothetical protein
VSKVRSLTELCGLRVSVETYVSPKGPLQCKRCQRFGHTQRNCGYAPRCVACGGSHLSGGCATPREQPQCCGCRGNHTVNYRGCIKWRGEGCSCKASARACPKECRHRPTCRSGSPAGRTFCRADGIVRGVESRRRRGRVVKATTTPIPNPSPQPVTEAPEQPKVTATRMTPRPKKPERKSTAAPKSAAGKPKKQPRVSKPRLPNRQPLNWWSPPKLPPPHSRKSLIS